MQISASLSFPPIFVFQGANMRQISKTTECTILTLMGNTLENIQDSEKSKEASVQICKSLKFKRILNFYRSP